MISSFRRYLETWYFRAFFFVMVASFVLWGVGDMLRLLGTSTWAAKVGGTTIEAQELQNEYRRALSIASRDLPSGQEPSAELRRAVLTQSLQRLITQAALNQEVRTLRVVVPEPVLVATIRKLPEFKGADGSFSKPQFDAMVRRIGLSESGFLDLMRVGLAQQQVIDAVTAGATVPEAEAAPIYSARFEKRSADIASFPIATSPEAAVPDETAVRRWYDNHPDLYGTPEYRRVKVLVLSPATMAPGIEVTDKDVEGAYAEHRSEYTTIALRSARVISAQGEAEAKALADQWRAGAAWPAMEAAAKAAGAAALTQEDAPESLFPDPDLARAVFGAPLNTVSEPVKGALGWFVIQVTKVVEGGSTPFDTVKDKLRQRVITERALELIYDEANKIDGQLGNGTNLDALSADRGVAVATVETSKNGTTPDGTAALPPGEEAMHTAIVAAAFEVQKGDQPHLTEVATPATGGSGYFALVLEDITPAGQKPFEAVREAAAQDWRADQWRHTVEQAAAAMLKAVKDGAAFSDAAREAGVVPRLSPLIARGAADPGVPPEVQQVLFSLKKGEPTMVENAEEFMVATPVEIVAPDPAADKAAYEQTRAAVARTVRDDLGFAFTQALRQRANPRINQANVDQIVQP